MSPCEVLLPGFLYQPRGGPCVPTSPAARWSPSQQRDTERWIPCGIQTLVFMEVVHGVGPSVTLSSSSSVTKCHLSLRICWAESKHKVLVSCAFLIVPSLKQPLKASQHVKEEEELKQWAIRPQLWTPESSFQGQSEAQDCTDGISDTGVPLHRFGQLGSHRAWRFSATRVWW